MGVYNVAAGTMARKLNPKTKKGPSQGRLVVLNTNSK